VPKTGVFGTINIHLDLHKEMFSDTLKLPMNPPYLLASMERNFVGFFDTSVIEPSKCLQV